MRLGADDMLYASSRGKICEPTRYFNGHHSNIISILSELRSKSRTADFMEWICPPEDITLAKVILDENEKQSGDDRALRSKIRLDAL